MADAEEGINRTEPDILTVFLLEGGTKAGGKDIGTGSFSNAQYTKNMAFKRDEPGSYILKSFNNIHPLNRLLFNNKASSSCHTFFFLEIRVGKKEGGKEREMKGRKEKRK